MNVNRLTGVGWTEFFDTHFQPYAGSGYSPGRIALEHKKFYRVYTEQGEVLAEISGRLRHQAVARADLPVVGDWVVLRLGSERGRARIHEVLPRKGKFTRKTAGARTEEQIIAANIDTVFVVTSLNQDFNPRRIERYLTLAWESGASPAIILSKSDLCDEVESRIMETERSCRGVPIHAISTVTHDGLNELMRYFGQGQTVALLGSSGVGKSTLINYLIGSNQLRVQEVREQDGRGRHTTTHRELILLPSGGLVIDTPGLRELQLWDGDGLQRTFDDIEALARRCYFGDCRHGDEPRCAVREALDHGVIDEERYLSYEKLQKELSYLSRKRDIRAEIVEKKRWKKLSRMATERAETKRR